MEEQCAKVPDSELPFVVNRCVKFIMDKGKDFDGLLPFILHKESNQCPVNTIGLECGPEYTSAQINFEESLLLRSHFEKGKCSHFYTGVT